MLAKFKYCLCFVHLNFTFIHTVWHQHIVNLISTYHIADILTIYVRRSITVSNLARIQLD